MSELDRNTYYGKISRLTRKFNRANTKLGMNIIRPENETEKKLEDEELDR